MTFNEGVEVSDVVVWVGVMQTLSFYIRKGWFGELNPQIEKPPLFFLKSAADYAGFGGSCFPTLVLSRSGREGRPRLWDSQHIAPQAKMIVPVHLFLVNLVIWR
jgi:hypothetical protein